MTRPRLVAPALMAVAALTLALLLSACGGSSSSSSSESTTGGSEAAETTNEGGTETASSEGGSGEELVVGVSSASLVDPFQALLQEQIVSEAEAAGAKVLNPTNANEDSSKQLADIQSLLAQGANGLIVVPRDTAAIVPAIESADKAGAKVIDIDQAPDSGEVAMIVRANNVEMGEEDCEFIGAELKGKGKVLELQGDLASPNGRDRTDGFNECMQANYPEIEIIEQPTKWESDAAAKATETVLTSTPDINAIYMESDSVMLSAVQAVLKREGHTAKVGQPGHIILATIDGTPLVMEEIRAGNVDAAVSQPLGLYAKYAASYAEEAVEGAEFHTGPTDHESEIAENETGNLEDLLPAPLVTKKNASDPELWGNQAKE
jgi:ribose transport system substrate-binding protein